MLIEMNLAGVRIELPTNQPIVLLREASGTRYLPIWIGQPEAQAIAMVLQGVSSPRPMTHDLIRDLLDELGVSVVHVAVTELRDGTFYAVLSLNRAGTTYEVSARPSDAIALAVRLGCKILVADDVLGEASILLDEEDGEGGGADPEEEVERFREFLDRVDPEEFR